MNNKENGRNILLILFAVVSIWMLYLIVTNFDEFIIFTSQFLV